MEKITSILALTFLTVLSFSSLSASHTTKSVFLPPPTGKHAVGTIEIELIDTSCTDALAPNTLVSRSFMVQLFYPTKKPQHSFTRASYMRVAAAAYLEEFYGFPNGTMSSIKTNSYTRAPISLPKNTANVVLFSPGFQYSRIFYTSLAEELASQGYVVIAIDHTHDAIAVEFPDGSLKLSAFLNVTNPPEQVSVEQIALILDSRTGDVNFTLNTFLDNNLLHQIPSIKKSTKLGGIGMYGHSFGGATAAEVAHLDDRILGGLNMDGTFFGTVVTEGLDKPFLVMGAGTHNGTNDPTWTVIWDNLRGWKRHVQLVSAEHMAYSDFPALIELLGISSYFPPGHLGAVYGTIDGIRAVFVGRAYVVAFFDFLLRERSEDLLDGPSDCYPEITFPPTI